MARIPYFDLAEAPAELHALLGGRPPLNIYRMVAHGGATAQGFLALGSSILRHSSLPVSLRELVILRVGALCGSSYEVTQHRRVGAQAGVSSARIDAVLDHPQGSVDRASFDGLECRVLDFADAVVRQVKAPREMFDALAAELPHQQLMEIVMTIGYYMLVCRVLENFEVDLEGSDVLAGHAPWAEILRQN
ncbi:carboxymuconolactone decarboxylase family protein [Variovorax sp. Varisp62]|uniref:carboxymuconolactone decarboxylase family protein n=1 Tax=Variovorax sp. Varisp62 TaxID=3243049 RepID=UPI0039B5F6C3